MRLGFDLDEVVVCLNKRVEEYLASTYGIDWSVQSLTSSFYDDAVFHADKETNKEILADIIPLLDDPDFQAPCEPVPGAVKALQDLKKHGHKLFFISARPPENRDKTIAWLKKHKIKFDEVATVGHHTDKGIYGRKFKLDMYVDDLPKHLESMSKYKSSWRKGLLLFDNPWNNDAIDANKYTRVYSWKEIIRHIGVQNR